MTWWKPRPSKSREIPVYTPVERRTIAPKHSAETAEEAIRYVRTHIAALAGEMSNLNVRLGMLLSRVEGQDAAAIVSEKLVHSKLNQIHDTIRRAVQ